MPNLDMAAETKGKQPTGSSKRKRKQSIKRNIVQEEDELDDIKPPKVEKTYGKRNKAEKSKSKDENEVVISEETSENASCPIHVEECQDPLKIEEDTKEGAISKQESNTQGNSTKPQRQNCKFCAEHTQSKQESDETKKKQGRPKKKFPCEICANDGTPRVYNSLEKHKHHMATAHEIYGEEIKKFMCTDCPGKVWFPTKSKFTYHIGKKHPGIIRFICDVCTETFKLKANYKTHLKTHNIVVQKKFSCNVCNGTFVNKAGYEAHKKRFPGFHIKQSCAHCGFSFSKEKHMKNHRCKTLLLEEAAARSNNTQQLQTSVSFHPQVDPLKLPVLEKNTSEESQLFGDKNSIETDEDLENKKQVEDSQGNKRVVLHRIIPRRSQDQTVYRPVQSQGVPESVVVQELREIDFEGGTFIAAATDPEQQFIVRDLNGHIVPGNQILQLDINDVQPGEESQVYFADWNIVAPYVIREKSP